MLCSSCWQKDSSCYGAHLDGEKQLPRIVVKNREHFDFPLWVALRGDCGRTVVESCPGTESAMHNEGAVGFSRTDTVINMHACASISPQKEDVNV